MSHIPAHSVTITYEGNLIKVGNTSTSGASVFFSVYVNGTYIDEVEPDDYSYVVAGATTGAASTMGSAGAVSLPFNDGEITGDEYLVPVVVQKLALIDFFDGVDNEENRKYAVLKGHLKLKDKQEGEWDASAAMEWFKFKVTARQHNTLEECRKPEKAIGSDIANVTVSFGTGEYLMQFGICSHSDLNMPMAFKADSTTTVQDDWDSGTTYNYGERCVWQGKTWQSKLDCVAGQTGEDLGDPDAPDVPGVCNLDKRPPNPEYWVQISTPYVIGDKPLYGIDQTKLRTGDTTTKAPGEYFLVKVTQSFIDFLNLESNDWSDEAFKYQCDKGVSSGTALANYPKSNVSEGDTGTGLTPLHLGKKGSGYLCMHFVEFGTGAIDGTYDLVKEATGNESPESIFEFSRWWHWASNAPDLVSATPKPTCPNCFDKEIATIKRFLVEEGYKALRNAGFPYIVGTPIPAGISFASGGADGTEGFISAYELRARAVQKQMVLGEAVTSNIFDVTVPLQPKVVDNAITAMAFNNEGDPDFTKRLVDYYGQEIQAKTWKARMFLNITKTKTVEMVNIWQQTVVSSLAQVGPDGQMEAEVLGTKLELENHFMRMYESASAAMGFSIGNRYFKFNTTLNLKQDVFFDDEETALLGQDATARYVTQPYTISSNIQVKRLFSFVKSFGSKAIPGPEDINKFDPGGELSQAAARQAQNSIRQINIQLSTLRTQYKNQNPPMTLAEYNRKRMVLESQKETLEVLVAKRVFWDDTLNVQLPTIKNGVYDINDISFNYAVDLPNNFKIKIKADESGGSGTLSYEVKLGDGKSLGMSINTEGRAALSYNYEKKVVVKGVVENFKMQTGLVYNHQEARSVDNYEAGAGPGLNSDEMNTYTKKLPIKPSWGCSFDMMKHFKVSLSEAGFSVGTAMEWKKKNMSGKAGEEHEVLSEMVLGFSAGIAPRYESRKRQVDSSPIFVVDKVKSSVPSIKFNLSYTRNLGHWGTILGDARLLVNAKGSFGGVNTGTIWGTQMGLFLQAGVQLEMQNLSYLGELLNVKWLDFDFWPTVGFQWGFYHGDVKSGFGNTWSGSASGVGLGIIGWTMGRRDKIKALLRRRNYSKWANIAPEFLDFWEEETDEDFIIRVIPTIIDVLDRQAYDSVKQQWEAEFGGFNCLTLMLNDYPSVDWSHWVDELDCNDPAIELEIASYLVDFLDLVTRYAKMISVTSGTSGNAQVQNQFQTDMVKVHAISAEVKEWLAAPNHEMCHEEKVKIDNFLAFMSPNPGWRMRKYMIDDIKEKKLYTISEPTWDYVYSIKSCGKAKFPSLKSDDCGRTVPREEDHEGALGKHMQDWQMDKYIEIHYAYIQAKMMSTAPGYAGMVAGINSGPRGLEQVDVDKYGPGGSDKYKDNPCGDAQFDNHDGDGCFYTKAIYNGILQHSMEFDADADGWRSHHLRPKDNKIVAEYMCGGKTLVGPRYAGGNSTVGQPAGRAGNIAVDMPQKCFHFQDREGNIVGYYCQRSTLNPQQDAKKMSNAYRMGHTTDLEDKAYGACYGCLYHGSGGGISPPMRGSMIAYNPIVPSSYMPGLSHFCFYLGEMTVKGSWDLFKNWGANWDIGAGDFTPAGKRSRANASGGVGSRTQNGSGTMVVPAYPKKTDMGDYMAYDAQLIEFYDFIKATEFYCYISFFGADSDLRLKKMYDIGKFKRISCQGPHPNLHMGSPEFDRYPFDNTGEVNQEGFPIDEPFDCGLTRKNYNGLRLQKEYMKVLANRLPTWWGGQAVTESSFCYDVILEHNKWNGPAVSGRCTTAKAVISDPVWLAMIDLDYSHQPYLTSAGHIKALNKLADETIDDARATHIRALKAVSDPQKLGAGQGKFSKYVINRNLFSQYITTTMDPYQNTFEIAKDANTMWQLAKKFAKPIDQIEPMDFAAGIAEYLEARRRLSQFFGRAGDIIKQVIELEKKKANKERWISSTEDLSIPESDKAIKREMIDSIRKYLYTYCRQDMYASDLIMRHALRPLQTLILNRACQVMCGGMAKHWKDTTPKIWKQMMTNKMMPYGPPCAGWGRLNGNQGRVGRRGKNWWDYTVTAMRPEWGGYHLQGYKAGIINTFQLSRIIDVGGAGSPQLFGLPYGAPYRDVDQAKALAWGSKAEACQLYSMFNMAGATLDVIKSNDCGGAVMGKDYYCGPGPTVYHGMGPAGAHASARSQWGLDAAGQGSCAHSYKITQAIIDISAVLETYFGSPNHGAAMAFALNTPFEKDLYDIMFFMDSGAFWAQITEGRGGVPGCKTLVDKLWNINADYGKMGLDQVAYSATIQRMNMLLGKNGYDLSLLQLLQVTATSFQSSLVNGVVTFKIWTKSDPMTPEEEKAFLAFWNKISPF